MNLFVSVSSYQLGKHLGIEAAHAEFQRQLQRPSNENLPCIQTIHRLQHLGADIELFHNWSTDLPKLRSRAAHAFLASNCETWVTIDDDVTTDPRTLETLLRAAAPDSISVLPCLIRGTEAESTRINVVYASPLVFERHGVQVRRLLRGGTGLMVSSRAAIRAMADRWRGELEFLDDDDAEPKVALFAQVIAERRWYGEDFSFCVRAAAADVQIYAPAHGLSLHDGRRLELDQLDVQA